jgi:hypothetical protein
MGGLIEPFYKIVINLMPEWPDWVIFRKFGYFSKLSMNFFKWSSPQDGDILATFSLSIFSYIFTLLSSFKTWDAGSIFKSQKWFVVDVLDFQI